MRYLRTDGLEKIILHAIKETEEIQRHGKKQLTQYWKPPPGNGKPSVRFHVILGAGIPLASHFKVTFDPSFTMILESLRVLIVGATEIKF